MDGIESCPHGHLPPHCPVTGCESSRPAMRLEDWIRQSTETRTPSMEIAPPRIAVAPLTEEERAERERAGRELQRHLDQLAKRDNASGDITRGHGFIGKTEDGKVPKGAHDTWWDPPRAEPDDHHQFPVVISGLLMWQQGPAMHCDNSVFADDTSELARQYRRAIAIAREQRGDFEEVAELIREDAADMESHQVAEALGLTASQLRRKRRGRRLGR